MLLKENNKMTKNHLSPHDRFTRSAMSQPKVAEELFQKHMPEHIKKIIDFSSIELQKESFIDDKLKLKIVDLLYSVKFNGQPGFLYILFEHASTPHVLLPFRMLKYMIAIMDQHLNTTNGQQLPLIYPLILYNGKKPYTYSMNLFDLFSPTERELAKETLMSSYHLIDLTQISDEELKPYLWFGTMALVLKHIHDLNILPVFKEMLCAVKELEKKGAQNYTHTIITYIRETGKVSHPEDWVTTIKGLEPKDKENKMKLMTLIEQLKPDIIQWGIEKGLQQGIEQGIEQGIVEGKIQTARALLLQGVDIETIAKATQLSKTEIKNLLS